MDAGTMSGTANGIMAFDQSHGKFVWKGLTNLSTQTALLGIDNTTGYYGAGRRMGYITLGSGLTLANGVLSSQVSGLTANNGLTMETASNVQLGGTLIKDTTIANQTFRLLMTGQSATQTFTVNNTSTGTAVWGISSGGYGGYFNSTIATALYASSNPTTTNTTVTVAELVRTTQNTAANDIAGSLDLKLKSTANNIPDIANKIIWTWTEALSANRTSRLEFWGTNLAVTARKASIAGSGQWVWDTYGTGLHTGTAAKWLTVTATGAVIESDPPTAAITANNGLTMSTATNVQLGGTLIQNTTINATASYTLAITGSTQTNVFTSTSTTGTAIRAQSTTGTAIQGVASGSAAYGGYFEAAGSGGIGVYAQANNNTNSKGGWFSSNNGLAIQANINPASTNASAEVIQLYRNTTGTAANGIGGHIGFQIETTTSVGEAGRVGFSWEDATHATRSGRFNVAVTTAGATSATNMMYITSTGLMVLTQGAPEYTDNAAAVAAGLAVGSIYRTGDNLKIVH